MKPVTIIHVFAGISITALSLQIYRNFWLPFFLGALAIFVIAVLLRK